MSAPSFAGSRQCAFPLTTKIAVPAAILFRSISMAAAWRVDSLYPPEAREPQSQSDRLSGREAHQRSVVASNAVAGNQQPLRHFGRWPQQQRRRGLEHGHLPLAIMGPKDSGEEWEDVHGVSTATDCDGMLEDDNLEKSTAKKGKDPGNGCVTVDWGTPGRARQIR